MKDFLWMGFGTPIERRVGNVRFFKDFLQMGLGTPIERRVGIFEEVIVDSDLGCSKVRALGLRFRKCPVRFHHTRFPQSPQITENH